MPRRVGQRAPVVGPPGPAGRPAVRRGRPRGVGREIESVAAQTQVQERRPRSVADRCAQLVAAPAKPARHRNLTGALETRALRSPATVVQLELDVAERLHGHDGVGGDAREGEAAREHDRVGRGADLRRRLPGEHAARARDPLSAPAAPDEGRVGQDPGREGEGRQREREHRERAGALQGVETGPARRHAAMVTRGVGPCHRRVSGEDSRGAARVRALVSAPARAASRDQWRIPR
jgi:hypothetical protein